MSGKAEFDEQMERLPALEVQRANDDFRKTFVAGFYFPKLYDRQINFRPNYYWTNNYPKIRIDEKPQVDKKEDPSKGLSIGNSEDASYVKLNIPTGISSSAVKLKRFRGDDIAGKLFIYPNIPFNISLSAPGGGNQFPVSVMTLYHPCPIRIENIQYDAVLSLGDISVESIDPKGPQSTYIILIPIQVSNDRKHVKSDAFFQKIVASIPGILETVGQGPDLRYDPIDVNVGNDFSLEKIIPLDVGPGGAVAKGGFFAFQSSPDVSLIVKNYHYKLWDEDSGGAAQFNNIIERKIELLGIDYGWKQRDNAPPLYIMMKDPVGVTPTTMSLIKSLPITTPKYATHPPKISRVFYKPGPPGDGLVGCPSKAESLLNMLGGVEEGFEGGKCDPFNNFPNSSGMQERRIQIQQTAWKIIGAIGGFFTIILTVWLALKFVQSSYGKNLFGSFAEKLSDAFSKVKNVPSMFGKGEGGSTTETPSVSYVNPLLQRKKISTPNIPKFTLPTNETLSNLPNAVGLIRQKQKVLKEIEKLKTAREVQKASQGMPNYGQKETQANQQEKILNDEIKKFRDLYTTAQAHQKEFISQFKQFKPTTSDRQTRANLVQRLQESDSKFSEEEMEQIEKAGDEQAKAMIEEKIKKNDQLEKLIEETKQQKQKEEQKRQALVATYKKKRKIAIEEPDEEEEKKSAAQIAKEAADIATEFLEKNKELKEEIKDQKADIKKIRTDFTKTGEAVPAMKLNELRKIGNQVEKVEKEVKELEEDVKKPMTEEEKEQYARNWAEAKKVLTFTRNTLHTTQRNIALSKKSGGKTTRRRKH